MDEFRGFDKVRSAQKQLVRVCDPKDAIEAETIHYEVYRKNWLAEKHEFVILARDAFEQLLDELTTLRLDKLAHRVSDKATERFYRENHSRARNEAMYG